MKFLIKKLKAIALCVIGTTLFSSSHNRMECEQIDMDFPL